MTSPSRQTDIQETRAKGWLLKKGQERIRNDQGVRLLPGEALLDDFAEDVKEKLLCLLDPRRLDAWDNQFNVGRTLGEASSFTKEGDGLHPAAAGFLKCR